MLAGVYSTSQTSRAQALAGLRSQTLYRSTLPVDRGILRTMSQENVDRVHRAHEAFNRRDLDAFLALMDPEVQLTTRFMELEGDPYYRGHDGVREWWRTLFAVFPDFTTEVLEVRELDGSLVVVVRVRGHGLEGGAPFEEVLWQGVKLRDGRATWWRNFASEAEALEAAGLSEQAMSQENVERFHRIYERWYEDRRLGPDMLADDVEWVNPPDAVEPGIRRGIDSFNDAIQSVFDAWEEVRFDTDRVIDHGEDVVALGQVRGRGRAAGIEVVRDHGEIWTFNDTKVTRMRWFHSRAETLKAAGLPD